MVNLKVSEGGSSGAIYQCSDNDSKSLGGSSGDIAAPNAGYCDSEPSSLFRSLRLDLSPMPLDDGLDDGESQAAAGIGRGAAPAVQTLEEMGQV